MEAFKEKEYKMLISEQQYQALLDATNAKPVKQVNYYYYSNVPGMAMRTRVREGVVLFTLKVKKEDYNDEYEFEISDNSLNDPKVQDLLKRFNITNYSYMASNTTYRATVELEKGELCIDKNEYLGKTDYEIEYELYSSDTDNNIEQIELLKKFNIDFKQNFVSKYRRCMEEYQKMKTIILLAPGCEECEALITYDLLWRGGVDVKLVGLENEITSSHSVTIKPHMTIDEVKEEECNCLVLPGGIPGTPNLEANPRVQELIDNFLRDGKYVCAICAAPSILAHKGLLKDNHFICHPGFECGMTPANVKAFREGNIITGKGVGATFEFATEILSVLKGEEFAKETLKKTQW